MDVHSPGRGGDRSGINAYWWARPSHIALFIHVPVFLACSYLDGAAFAHYKHPRSFLEGQYFWLGLAAIIGFSAAAFVFEQRRPRIEDQPRVDPAAVTSVLTVLFGLALVANAIFLFPLVFRPHLLLEHLRGSESAMYELRETLNRIPGVTSFVSLQSVIVALMASYHVLTRHPLPRLFLYLLAFVVVACVLRAWLWSERLALIELAMPAVVALWAFRSASSERVWLHRATILAPVVGFIAVYGIFALGEYFRSWQYYRHEFAGTFGEFIWTRFVGYYATALNNGAAFCTLHEPLYAPTMSALWIYKLPLPASLVPEPTFDYLDFIAAYLNPEFNNTGGIYMPLLDFGAVLGVASWIVLGAVSGLLFSAFARRQIAGLLLYPIWFIGIVEMLRLFYWGDSRFFPVVVVSLSVCAYLGRRVVNGRRAASGPAPICC